MKLSEIVKTYREKHNLSMDEMAAICHVSKGYISMLEAGVNPKTKVPMQPKASTLVKIAKGLNMKLDDFIKLIGDDAGFKFTITKEEDLTISLFRKLNSTGKEIAINQLKALARMDNLTKK